MQTPDAKQLAVVSLDDAGVCGTCGQVTAYGCPSCLVAHFCSRSCLQLAFRAHSLECGLPGQVKVDMPSQADAANPVNTRLLMHGCFSLKTTKKESAPHLFAVLPQHGLVPLEVPTDLCSPLVQVLMHSRSPDGFVQLAGREFFGYESYSLLASGVTANSYEQSRRTTMLLKSKGHLKFWCKNCPSFMSLVCHVAAFLQCSADRLLQVHFLQQASPQCQFSWHQDHKDLHLSTDMITVVICLQGTHTGVQIWGFRPYMYPQVGSGVAFPGASTHRSVFQVMGSPYTGTEVVKVGMFWD